MNYFDSGVLRLLWSLVESHASFLRSLSDDAIVMWLLKTLRSQICVTHDDSRALQEYLSTRICLIRTVIEPPSLA
jgi:hypothetical protein